jgi:hypothetical protein
LLYLAMNVVITVFLPLPGRGEVPLLGFV